MTTRPGLLAALVLFLLVWPMEQSPCGDGGCPNVTIPPSGPDLLLPFLSKNGVSCAQGAYVRINGGGYLLDARTEVSGACEIYIPQGQACVWSKTDQRGVTGTNIQEDGVGGQVVYWPEPAPSYPQVFDTRVPGSAYPDDIVWYFNNEGERTLRYRSNIYVTGGCTIMPSSITEVFPARAVKCLPRWPSSAFWRAHSQQSSQHHRQSSAKYELPDEDWD